MSPYVKFVCPKPQIWHRIHQRLLKAWEAGGGVGSAPPVPLILGGWMYTNDVDKQQRWTATVEWAEAAGLEALMPELSDEEGYWVSELDSSPIGPMGGPMYLPWSGESKRKPTAKEYQTAFERLRAQWDQVAGPDLARISAPLMFAGDKLRNLVVAVEAGHQAPWGTWTELSPEERMRRTFTEFRKRVNEVIAPHKVDHVTFRETGT